MLEPGEASSRHDDEIESLWIGEADDGVGGATHLDQSRTAPTFEKLGSSFVEGLLRTCGEAHHEVVRQHIHRVELGIDHRLDNVQQRDLGIQGIRPGSGLANRLGRRIREIVRHQDSGDAVGLDHCVGAQAQHRRRRGAHHSLRHRAQKDAGQAAAPVRSHDDQLAA